MVFIIEATFYPKFLSCCIVHKRHHLKELTIWFFQGAQHSGKNHKLHKLWLKFPSFIHTTIIIWSHLKSPFIAHMCDCTGKNFQTLCIIVNYLYGDNKQIKHDCGRDWLAIHQPCITFLLGREPNNIISLPCSQV